MGTAAAIRVVIVDDHAMVAEALATAVDAQPDVAVVGVAGTLEQGTALIAAEQPDVVVMDHRLPDGDSASGTRRGLAAAPAASVLVITAEPTRDVAGLVLEAGCAGLLPKDRPVDEVVGAIRAVARGETVFSRALLAEATRRARPSENGRHDLTARELEVLRLLHEGASTEQIAERLVVSLHTVRNHIRNLTAKLGATSRIEALAAARRAGLVDDG